MTLGNVGGVYIALGQYSQALDFYRQALTILRDTGNRKEEGESLSQIGLALFQTDRLAAAEEALFESITVLESLRASELSDADKVALFETEVSNNKLLQQVLIAQNKTEAALEVAERGRARVFVEQLATKLSESQSKAILTNAPDLAAIRRTAQQQNATLVEYSAIDSGVGNPTLYIWVIQPTGKIHFQSVDLTTLDQQLSDLVTTSREVIGVRNRSEPATIVPELKPEAQQRQQAQQRQKLQQLHQLLIEPIAQYLPSNPDERVIFIPQGELFLVPFPALVNAKGKYLIEKHTILTAPSIQVLDLTRQQRQSIGANRRSPIRGDDALVVGNPIMPKVWNPAKGIEEQLSSLPGAEEEAVTIAKVFATKPLLWEQASESAVVEQMPEARIIHLSTHGLLEYGTPQDSGVRDFPGAIALSPSAKDDGLLTSAEILKMKLKAELVVLSACDTGRGRIRADGVIGLSRSLITAGVPSVIVSLWSVPDAPTAELMSEFYRQWQQNPDKAKALRQAMLITMQNHPNPRDWAAFTLIGESE
jgi:CHAT domain-containing protein